MKTQIRSFVLLLLAVGSLLLPANAQVAARQKLSNTVPSEVSQLQPISRLPGDQVLTLAFVLPGRNPQLMDQMVQDVANPASRNYRHYLTPDQITSKFGPTAQDYQTLIAFVQANGMTVTAQHPGRKLLDVQAPVNVIETAFKLQMSTYQHPTENRTFYSANVDPTLALNLPGLRVQGLETFHLPRPALAKSVVNPATSSGLGTGSNSAYWGYDFRNIYAPGVALTGNGQFLALVEAGGYYFNDISNYALATGLPLVPLTNVLVGGYNGAPIATTVGEVSLDIEMAMCMAPGLTGMIVYEGPHSAAGLSDALDKIETDNIAKQISMSYTSTESEYTGAWDYYFQAFALQGQSFFAACGDYGGALTNGNYDDSPYATTVGGTFVYTQVGTGTNWLDEVTWNDYLNFQGNAYYTTNNLAGAGGISVTYSIPPWQAGVSMAINGGSTTKRNFPDVSLNALWN